MEEEKSDECANPRCSQRETCILTRIRNRKKGVKPYYLASCVTTSSPENLAEERRTNTNKIRQQKSNTNEAYSEARSQPNNIQKEEEVSATSQTVLKNVRITTETGKISFQNMETNAIIEFFAQKQ